MPDAARQLIDQHSQLRRVYRGQHDVLGGHMSAEHRAEAFCDLVTIHSQLAEETVFPAFRQLDPALVDQAEAGNQRIGALVEKIRGQGYVDNGAVQHDLASLEQEIEGHIQLEEETLLPRMKELPPQDAEQLGQALYERHQELLQQSPKALEIAAETEGFRAGHWI